MFKLYLINRNDNPIKRRRVQIPDPDDFLADIYNDAFQEELRQEPELISRTFRAIHRHRITRGLLEKLCEKVQEQFAVRKVGDSIKFIDKGHEAKLKAIELAKKRAKSRQL